MLDARDTPRVAFTYKWIEKHEDGTKTEHTVDVPYETSVPLLCTFPAPQTKQLLTGSFFASSSGASDFYRGMQQSAVMQRRKHSAMDAE